MTRMNTTIDLRNLPLTCDGRSASQPEAGGQGPRSHVKGLPAGTPVVSTLDGEPGRIIKVCSQNRSRTKATAYVVRTAEGREVWEVQDIFLPIND